MLGGQLPIPELVFYPLCAIAGYALGTLAELIAPYLPDFITHPPRKFLLMYKRSVWRLTPDWMFRYWYRCGIMTGEDYRALQDAGCISDDVDPKYLTRNYVPDDS